MRFSYSVVLPVVLVFAGVFFSLRQRHSDESGQKATSSIDSQSSTAEPQTQPSPSLSVKSGLYDRDEPDRGQSVPERGKSLALPGTDFAVPGTMIVDDSDAELPEDFRAQLGAQNIPLPDEFRRQLRSRSSTVPEDLKRQLENDLGSESESE